METFNFLLTVTPGHDTDALLEQVGAACCRLSPTAFPDVMVGTVADLTTCLEALRNGLAAGAPWARALGRAVPVSAVFAFTADNLVRQANDALSRVLPGLPADASLAVRVAGRDLDKAVDRQAAEGAIGEHVLAWGHAHGNRWLARLGDPDYLIVLETLGNRCALVLLPRTLRSRYPFVHSRGR